MVRLSFPKQIYLAWKFGGEGWEKDTSEKKFAEIWSLIEKYKGKTPQETEMWNTMSTLTESLKASFDHQQDNLPKFVNTIVTTNLLRAKCLIYTRGRRQSTAKDALHK